MDSNNPNTMKPKKGTPIWMILVPVIIGALLLMGVGGYFLLAKKKATPVVVVDDDEDEEEEEESYTLRMTGYVDQYPVRMRLEVSGSTVNGEYYYESQGPEKRLLLSGTLRRGQADLNETTFEGQPTGHFRGRLTRSSFEGEFIDGRGNSMYFSLSK